MADKNAEYRPAQQSGDVVDLVGALRKAVAAARERRLAERTCSICHGRVDDEGESVGECSWVQSAACSECGGCLCDGSC